MRYTENYKLKMPEGKDIVNIDDINSNIDVIDKQLKSVSEKVGQTDLEIYSKYKLNKDANGVFTEVQYKRQDGSLYMKDVLSGGTSPDYTTRTQTYYRSDNSVIKETNFKLIRDADGDIVSEVII